MLGPAPVPVKPKWLYRHGICPLQFAQPGVPRQTGRLTTLVPRVTIPSFLLLVAVAAAIVGLAWRIRAVRRQRAVSELLDAADALEARLRTARAEIEAVAGDDADPVRDALREMLRQRLWLQQHGQRAALAELDAVRASIDVARQRIDQQLARIERARAPLA